MALLSKNSVLAIVPEVTEGTPVAPSASGQYLAMQSDFAITPSINVLDNAEIKASIAPSKPILGIENPTAKLSHYLKHSGVEGTAPEIDQLFKGLFGSEVIAATEYDTVAASTVSIIKVNTGEGAQYQRGQALMIKDPLNGYSIRPVLSVAGDNLTLGFNLLNAPALGVNLGKAVLYKPANTGHQSLSIWHYVAGTGAVQMVSGTKVTEAAMNFSAGELINCSFSMAGIGFYYDPIEITSSSKYLDFVDDDGTLVAAVATGFYKDPHDLASAIETGLNDASSKTYTCVYSDLNGKFTIASSDATTLTLKWNTGANTANSIASKIGFTTAADSSAALTYTSPNAMSFAAPQAGALDSSDPLVAKNNQLLLGDATNTSCYAASTFDVTITDAKQNINSICSASGLSGTLITGRTVSLSATALLEQYDADKFKRMRLGSNISLMYAFGSKVGGNWMPGKCGMVYAPTCVVQAVSVSDEAGIYRLKIDMTAYADNSSLGEIYLNFL